MGTRIPECSGFAHVSRNGIDYRLATGTLKTVWACTNDYHNGAVNRMPRYSTESVNSQFGTQVTFSVAIVALLATMLFGFVQPLLTRVASAHPSPTDAAGNAPPTAPGAPDPWLSYQQPQTSGPHRQPQECANANY